jgi:serine/threonine protein kinase
VFSTAGGQVYRGQYNGTTVAAKMIFSQSLTDQLEEFEREVNMLAALHHPNIIT